MMIPHHHNDSIKPAGLVQREVSKIAKKTTIKKNHTKNHNHKYQITKPPGWTPGGRNV